MGKKSIFALVLVSLLPGLSSALEIKNLKLTYGPLGAPRTVNKFLPGDIIFMTFDIEGLSFNQVTGKASYETELELWNPVAIKKDGTKGPEVVFSKKTPAEVPALLGGTRLPGDLHMIMGTDQKAGKYIVRLIVRDKLNGKQTYFDHPFDLLDQGFGLVGVTAPAIGFYGQHYACGFALVNMTLDPTTNKPNVDITMRVLDPNGTALTKPINTYLPADLPKEVNLAKENFLPMQFPIFLNRSGRYQIEIEATDKNAKQTTRLRYNLTVVDVDSIAGR